MNHQTYYIKTKLKLQAADFVLLGLFVLVLWLSQPYGRDSLFLTKFGCYFLSIKPNSGPEKTFFMLNSTEHEISLGHKSKNTKNLKLFSCSTQLSLLS